jgi:hypothetical protein
VIGAVVLLPGRRVGYVVQESGCWEWTGYCDPRGRGILGVDRRPMLASRYVWELEYGPIPEGMLVCHHCDNPPCVRTGHLFLGTYADNNRDRDRKHRNRRYTHTHCKHGHEFTSENTYRWQGTRYCRTCRNRNWMKGYREGRWH